MPYSTNGQTRTWTFSYGAGGTLLSVDGPLAGAGDTVTYAYSAAGYVNQVTNEVGHVTQITSINGRGQPLTVVDPNGITTTLAYDAAGRVKTVTVNPGAGQSVTSLDYDAIGQISRITRPDGATFDYVYSNARRLTSVTSNTGERIELTHDLLGNVLTRVIKSAGGTIVFSQSQTFDELGRLLKQIGAASQTTAFAYERNNNLKSVTDPRAGVYGYAFDSLNRLVGETDQEGGAVSLTLNGTGDVTTYADPRSLQTSYVRNGFGEVIQETSPDRGTTVYVRDLRGLVTQVTDGRGIVVSQSWDNAGRLITRAYPAAPAEDITLSYDATAGGNMGKGRLTGLASEQVTIARVYDARGNVVSETRTIAGKAHVIAYAYDAANRVTQVTYPSGRVVEYGRDATGRIASVKTRKTALDPAVDIATAIARLPLSNIVSAYTCGNGLSESSTFTLDYELDKLSVTDGLTKLLERTFARADKLNLTGITDGVTGANSSTFSYSAANRLKDASGPWGVKTYTFDKVGNRIQEDSTPVGGSKTSDVYAYPGASNKLVTVTRGAQTVRSFTYDGAGNILTDNRAGTTTTYSYNKRNRLLTATSGALVWGYTYNALEQLAIRTLSVGGSDVTHFIHDIFGNVIAETGGGATGATGTQREYIWLIEAEIAPTFGARAQVDRPLAVVEDVETASPQLWHVHVDHLHRPVRMTDAAKASVWQAEWLPWGQAHSITGSGALNYRFPGQWFQLEAGLHYNWHRHYDPSIGRYTQPDPLGFVDGPSVYGYARVAPAIFVDLDGRQVFPEDRRPFTPTESPFKYDPRVVRPGYDPMHNFPYSFDLEIWTFGYLCSCSINFRGASIYYQRCLRGALSGRRGTYELGFNIPLTGEESIVVHRFFRPD